MKHDLLIIYLLNICLVACGQKGPLRLPDSGCKDINFRESLHINNVS